MVIETQGIAASSSLTEILETAIKRHALSISSEAGAYVEGLVRQYIQAEDFHKVQEGCLPSAFGESIASKLLLLKEPLGKGQMRKMPRKERLKIFKEVGDSCLFVTGFFYECAEKKGSAQFYCRVGSGAYREVGKAQGPLYFELADNFDGLVLVIGDFWLPTLNNNKKLIQIYEKWEKTNSPYYHSLLIGKGIIPMKTKGGSN